MRALRKAEEIVLFVLTSAETHTPANVSLCMFSFASYKLLTTAPISLQSQNIWNTASIAALVSFSH